VDVPALEVVCDGGPADIAINDIVVVRDGPGQVIVSVSVDEVLWARVAGDGIVVATELGSSAYTMAAGGPLLAGVEGIVVTPLAPHGGSFPPLVAGTDSRLSLTVDPGYGGVRHELDGRAAPAGAEQLEICVRAGYATLVRLADEEPRLTGLRRRGLVLDSPRALVREGRLLKPVEPRPSA
jgi:NAD+ kinase